MNQITIFYNDQKGNPKAPFFTGKIVFSDGTEQRVSLWNNVSQTGVTYYNGNFKPFETKPAPAPAEPIQDQPATPEFIQETIEAWENRVKQDFPDLGRRRLDPPRDIEATNAFYKKLKYDESKALITTIERTPLDQMTEEMNAQYWNARAYVDQYKADNQDHFPGTKM